MQLATLPAQSELLKCNPLTHHLLATLTVALVGEGCSLVGPKFLPAIWPRVIDAAALYVQGEWVVAYKKTHSVLGECSSRTADQWQTTWAPESRDHEGLSLHIFQSTTYRLVAHPTVKWFVAGDAAAHLRKIMNLANQQLATRQAETYIACNRKSKNCMWATSCAEDIMKLDSITKQIDQFAFSSPWRTNGKVDLFGGRLDDLYQLTGLLAIPVNLLTNKCDTSLAHIFLTLEQHRPFKERAAAIASSTATCCSTYLGKPITAPPGNNVFPPFTPIKTIAP